MWLFFEKCLFVIYILKSNMRTLLSLLLVGFSLNSFGSISNHLLDHVNRLNSTELLKETIPSELARAGAISFVIGQEAYFGLGTDGTSFFRDFYRINVVTEEVTRIADFPGLARSEAIAFEVGGKGYVGTGRDTEANNLSDFYSYDPVADQWTQLTDVPGDTRHSAVTFVLGANGYVGTGRGDNGDLSDFWRYDIPLNAWIAVSAFSGDARQEAVAFTINEKGYVSGGFSLDKMEPQLSDVQEYDPVTESWSEKVFADINLGFQAASVFTLFDQAYIAYGNQDQVTRYDPATNEIQDLGDLFNIDTDILGPTRADALSFSLADTAYFGFGSSGFSPTTYHADLLTYFIPNAAPTDILLSNNKVDENQGIGTLIGMLDVIDENDNSNHVFELVEGNGVNDADNNSFQIFRTNLATNAILDFEEQSQFSILIRVTDEGDEFFEKAFTILLNNVNDAPIFVDQTFMVTENSVVNAFIGQPAVNDPESDPITFSIISGNIGDVFAFDEDQLIVSNSSLLDFESNESYMLGVTASDGVNSVLANFTINVLDENEAPEISDQLFTIVENSNNMSLIGNIFSEDPEGDEVILSIISGNEQNVFQLGENNSLEVANSSFLDFESNTSFNLSISASDGTLANNALITVNLTNINEAPQVENILFTLNESSENGALVGSVSATDPENDALTYVIDSGNIADAFSISNAGDLTVHNSEALNIEVNPSFLLNLTVSDGNLSSNFEVTVEVVKVTSTDRLEGKIAVYPNPVTELLLIDFGVFNMELYQLEILNLNGDVLLKKQAQESIDVSSLSQGTYFLRLRNGDDIEITRFIKR